MNRAEYDGVVENMRLPSGTLFPVPINLDVSDAKAKEIETSGKDSVVLKDQEGNPLAVMKVSDMWTPDKKREADLCWGGDPEHPAIDFLNKQTQNIYLGGSLTGLSLPPHYEYATSARPPRNAVPCSSRRAGTRSAPSKR